MSSLAEPAGPHCHACRASLPCLQDFEGWWVPRACARQAAWERSREDLSLVDYALRVAGVSLDGWAVFRWAKKACLALQQPVSRGA